jgi:hypothetical protein
MYLGLRQVLGDNVTSLLMERLPPDDFARSGEVQLLTLRIDFLNERMDMLERRVDGLTSTIKVLIGSMVTVSTVMIGLLVQIALTVS